LSRDNDVVSRFGGEEFGILLPDTTPEEAYTQVEAIRKAIEAAEFTVATSEVPIKTTMSFGVAGRIGTQQTAKEFIHCADVAVYEAKHTGRNRVCTYHPELDSLSTVPSAPQPESESIPLEVVTAPAAVISTAVTINGAASQEPVYKEEAIAVAASEAKTEETVNPPAPPADSRAVQLYVGALALSALALTYINAAPLVGVDWMGLLVFIFLAIVLELVATEVYSRDTSVSTSVAPIIGAMMAFGAIGAVSTCLAVSVITQFRTVSPSTASFLTLAITWSEPGFVCSRCS
jgi:hypothetical protein